MIRWLWKIIVGRRCPRECKWDLHERIDLWDSSVSKQRPVGARYIMRCTTCGEIKSRDVS